MAGTHFQGRGFYSPGRHIASALALESSLPHCGAVVAMLTITQLYHREACRDIGVVTVVIPVIATLVVMALAAVGLR